ncbi:MAG: amino acid adenylation domain-containing protein [Bacteroidetes bacterium]|nr:amino acid adenylation domain-containing protein [Bacteroidota bacterium]
MIENPQTNIGSIEQRIKGDLGFADKLTCYVVGEGRLAAQCIKILDSNKIKVLKVISGDEWLLAEFDTISLHGDALADGSWKLEPVDYIFSISNSIILKKEFISLAKIMAVNYHDAPLPRYAGMYATNWAIMNGEETHGIAWHKITDKVDAGDIVESCFFEIEADETAFSLNTKCFDAAIDSFEKLVNSIHSGSVCTSAQNLSERTYHGLGSRPRFFGCISPDQSESAVDRLLRATDFGRYNANEFALPLLFVNGNFYTIAKAGVLKDRKGPAGCISHSGGNHGFFCENGFIVPEVIYTSRGISIPVEELLATVTTVQVPDQKILTEAGNYFSEIAKYESYWKKQLLQAEYATWPVLSGDQVQQEATLSFDIELFDLLRQIFPGYDIQDTVTAAFCMFLLMLRDTESGTFGYMPAGDISPSLRQTEIFGSVVPFSINLRKGEDSVKAINRTLKSLKRTREAKTFTRSICLRYPELNGKTTSRHEIVISSEEADSKNMDEDGVLVSITGSGMKIFSTNPNRFGGLQAVIDHFLALLGNIFLSPSASFAELSCMSPASTDHVIRTLQSSFTIPVIITNVVSAFGDVVQKYPDNMAVFDAGKTYSYKTFSNDIATLSVRLRNMGVDNKVVAAVSIERSYHYLLSIMAILHCGAAFLPVDPKIPVERKKFICENAGASVLLIENEEDSLKTGIEEVIVSPLPLSTSAEAGNFQLYNPEDIAYIIYTSGSTGLPKGVKISNRNLANFISGAIHLYQTVSTDRVLQFSNLSFDASIEEIFCSFCTGASLYLRTEEMLIPEELIQFADQHNITVLDLPTFFWRRMIRAESMSSLQNKVKLIIVGGEALLPADVHCWNSINPGISLINTYGPTETTVVALACKISPASGMSDFVPIGRPLPGYQIYVVDKQRNILPLEVAGELLIAGNSVSPGYVNGLNDKAFVWINTPEDGPVRCYCTGDRVYSDNDGIVYFLGRIDHQLKIRGYRVEPGEIEFQICKLDGIETCSVQTGADLNGEVKLIAFYQSGSRETSASAYKNALKHMLPPYMIPDAFVKIQTMPLTPNGKIDKSRLLESAISAKEDESVPLDGPTNETEEYMLALWRRILGISQIGIHDDFFEIGGHSLKAVTLMAEIKKEKGIKIPLASLIQHSTIKKFARLVHLENKLEYWNCLVPIRPAGHKTPIFLIHGAGLNILFYKSLANHLSADRPIYAFQASGLDGSKQFKNNLPDIAEEYIRELLRIQPDGPFLLMGFSLGGFIAYEMAMQLTGRGLTVKFTGLIDSVSFLANYSKSYANRIVVSAQSIVLKPFYLFWLYLKEPNTEKKKFLENKYNNIRLTITYYMIRLGLVKRKKIAEELEQMSFLSDSMRISMNESLKKYELRPATFHIDLFVAGKPTFYIHERKTYGWANFAKQGLTIHTIPSEHSLLFAPPYDRYFAELLERRLEQIEAEQK